MRTNKMLKKSVAFLTVTALGITSLPPVAFSDAGFLKPQTPAAILDGYGNTFQDYDIDKSVSVFSDSANILSHRPSDRRIANDYNLSALKGVHPRILAGAEDFERIKALAQTDEQTKNIYDKVISNAGSLLNTEPLVYELRDGVRLWYVSMDFIDRMLTLSMAYRLTGDARYAKRGYEEMDAIAGFDTWHPEHHIDVGGLAVGYAIGYDWLYDYYTPSQRHALERAANRLCFSEYADGLQNRSRDMKGGILAENNHNAVMNSGGIMMSAAFYDLDPDTHSYIISSLIRATEYTVKNLVPDGSWYEGVSYASMMIEYYSLELCALKTLFGSTYGLEDVPGTDGVMDYIMNMQCPTGAFSYGDGGQGTVYNGGHLYMTELFEAGSENYESLMYYRGSDMSTAALSLLWYRGENLIKPERPYEAFYSRNSVVTARSSWQSRTPTFVGMKGASPKDTHAHMDTGTFCFYSDGTAWTRDVGAEDYNVENYWDYSDGTNGRWQYYRTRPEAHNCIVVNPSQDGGYVADSRCSFVRFESNDSGVISVLDMADAHGSKVNSALRGYYFCDSRQSLVVRDEITPTLTGKTAWFMSTAQAPEIIDGKVYLTDASGKKLKIEFATDCTYELYITSAEPLEGISPNPEGNSENKDISRIVVMLDTVANQPFSITAKLTPEACVNPSDILEYDMPVSLWTLRNTAPVIRLDADTDCDYLPVNTEFDVRLQPFGASSADTLKLYEQSSAGTLTELEYDVNLRFTAKVSDEEKYLVAKLFDSNGNEKAVSERLPLKYREPLEKIQVWDVDFEDVTTDAGKNLAAVKFYGPDGKLLTNSFGNTLTANRSASKTAGANSSVVDIAQCPFGSYGKSIYLSSVKSDLANDQAQLNQFSVNLTEGIAVMEMDYLFRDFNTNKIVAGLNCKNTSNSAFWAGMLLLEKDGYFSFGSNKLRCLKDTWYNVKLIYNINAGALSAVIDGKYMGTVYKEDKTLNTVRFSFQLTCTDNTEAYADNFKVTNLKY